MSKLNHKIMNQSRQSGMTLIISLIILIALTMLGVSSMQSTRTEISMAGNLRESGITFNAAEAGLRAAETFVETAVSNGVFSDPTIGLYPKVDNDPSYNLKVTWDASQFASVTLPDVMEPPKFIIKYLGDRSQNQIAKINIGGYGSGQPGITVSNFRITARGVGQSGNAFRIVQSYYGRQF